MADAIPRRSTRAGSIWRACRALAWPGHWLPAAPPRGPHPNHRRTCTQYFRAATRHPPVPIAAHGNAVVAGARHGALTEGLDQPEAVSCAVRYGMTRCVHVVSACCRGGVDRAGPQDVGGDAGSGQFGGKAEAVGAVSFKNGIDI